MTWGLSSWGGSPWGLASSVPFSIASAHARGELVVRVTLTRSARATGSATENDALNPRTWQVFRNDTLAEFTVFSVRGVDSDIPASVFELYLLQKLAVSGIDHTVKALTLVDNQGGLISSPKSFTFSGCRLAPQTPQASRNDLVDLARPPVGDGSSGSVFSVGSSGDYNVETGVPLLRKLFLRRLMTTPGGFFHLTDYGLGIAVKEPLNTARLSVLKNEVERQVKLEPEVDSASVSVRLDTNGLLQITLAVRLTSTGAEIKDTLTIPTLGS